MLEMAKDCYRWTRHVSTFGIVSIVLLSLHRGVITLPGEYAYRYVTMLSKPERL